MDPAIAEARARMIAKRFGGNAAGANADGVRRNKKAASKPVNADDKKLTTALKKVGLTNIPGIEEVNLFKEDGNVIHFSKPVVQAAVQANTFVVSGNGVTKPLEQLLPNILTQLGQDNIQSLLKRVEGMGLLKKDAPAAGAADDEVPALVENFEDAADK